MGISSIGSLVQCAGAIAEGELEGFETASLRLRFFRNG